MYRRSALIGLRGAVAAAMMAVAVPAASAAEKVDHQALARQIDRHISEQLKAEEISTSERSSDAEFLRRVYLDLTGKIPTAEKTAAFLDSKDPQKRALLIDEVLASKDYAKHQADVWQALLLPRNSDNRRLQNEPLVKWLEERFDKNQPWDKLAYDLLTAAGPQDKNGATTYWIANATPDKMTDSVCKVFLGVQLQCAQCHDHPFTAWKQTEYWEMAAFFMKVQTTRANQAARNGVSPTVTEQARAGRGRRGLPESAKIVPPKFLQDEKPKLDDKEPYRPVVAAWIARPENPYFSKAMVNRTWAKLFGRGLVNPIDDMRVENPATHPELLEDMAGQFAANGFDVKYLYRAICNSETYQRTSKPTKDNETASPLTYSRMNIKVLSPEQMFDSLNVALGGAERLPVRGGRNVPPARRGGNNLRDQFIAFFGVDEGADPTEYQAGIPQALRLMNSAQMNNAPRVASLLRERLEPAKVVEQLYLGTLSRRPSEAEMTRLTAHFKAAGDPRQAASDVLWVLINCSEFALNR